MSTRNRGYSPRLPSHLRFSEAAPPDYSLPPLLALAGTDPAEHWDPQSFLHRPIVVGRDYMRRMHHPFHEVLACLFLGPELQALGYERFFRDEYATALGHLDDVLLAAARHGATGLLLAHNPPEPPPQALSLLSAFREQLDAGSIRLWDYVLLGRDAELSFRAAGWL